MGKKHFLLCALLLVFLLGMLDGSTAIIAHRGASSVAPENTLAAFSKAIAFGADYFELDVWTSLDDSLMIIHDATIDRTTDGSGSVSTMTYDQLRAFDAGSWFGAEFTGEKIPTLAEALKLALASPYEVGVVVEIKGNTPTIVGKVITEVKKYQMQNRVIISSFMFDQIDQSKSIDVSIPVQLFGTITQTNINQIAGIGGEWAGTDGTITAALLDSAHVKNIKVNKWTVNSSSEMLSLMQLGVDAITTNFPQTAKALMDSTPPTDVELNEAVINVTDVELSWKPAEDAESGVAGYEIYRDPGQNATTLLTSIGDMTTFVDETQQETKTFYYRLKAKNGAGLTSVNYSNEIKAITDDDQQPPKVSSVSSFGPPTSLVVEFDEYVDQTTAENSANYQINNQINVTQARLALDSVSVILTTSEMSDNAEYILTISGISDLATEPNTIEQPINISFTHKNFLPQTVAAWDLNEGQGETFADQTGNNNTGTFYNGMGWSKGQIANGVLLDGIDDYAEIPASSSLDIDGEEVSVSVWARLDLLPAELPGAYGPIYDSETDNYVVYEDRGNNELRFKVTTSGGAERPGIPAADLKVNEWLHIVGVYDGYNAMIFLNGELKDTHELAGTVNTGQVARLGTSLGSYFKGSIDNIQIFDRALSDVDIQFLYDEIKISAAVDYTPDLPDDYRLGQNYPNPFNPVTTLKFTIRHAEHVTLFVYDVRGRKVAELVNERLNPGSYQVTWDGRDQTGIPVASGIYFYKISAGHFTATKKMTLIR
jgi:glycerophosphoryl diester phosphodiesterase